MIDPSPALYSARVVHMRRDKPKHRFAQSMLLCLVDIAALDGLARRLRLFSHNGFNLFALFDRDHGARDGSNVSDWVRAQLRHAALPDPGGSVLLLAQPRVLGYVFNPLSVYFCHDPDGTLRVLIYEVHNTHGEAHAYVAEAAGGTECRHGRDKTFRVSPFLPMAGTYDFRLKPPGETVHLSIGLKRSDGEVLFSATLDGTRQPLTDSALLGAFLRLPFSTQRTSAAIYRQAAAIWLKSRLGRT